ncbi:MAG TPA: hypothetical protein PLI99_04295 [archaeon]|nr:hypothetical protein [archaeon]
MILSKRRKKKNYCYVSVVVGLGQCTPKYRQVFVNKNQGLAPIN